MVDDKIRKLESGLLLLKEYADESLDELEDTLTDLEISLREVYGDDGKELEIRIGPLGRKRVRGADSDKQ